ncbi:TPA: hypothetical protein L3N15_004148 [Vibrio parahaemolyticus]|nr:hypothetical protein [Vibrio parahaemolyticus]
MAKVNYAVHQKAYWERKRIESNLTLQDYCLEVGINYNSARRYMKASEPTPNEDSERPISTQQSSSPTDKWDLLFKKYLLVAVEAPTYTAKDFAKEEGLNYNTLRRKFTEMRKAGLHKDLSDQFEEACKAHASRRISKAKDEQKQIHKERLAIAQENADARTQRAIDLMPTQEEIHDRQTTVFDRRQFINAFHPGHSLSSKHGAHSRLFRSCSTRIKKLISDLKSTDVEFELYSARVQYYSLLEYKEELLAELERKKEEDLPITDRDGNQSTYAKEKSKLIVAYAGRLRELEGSISGMVAIINANTTAQARLVLAAAKLPSVDMDEEYAIITNTLRQREENDWDASTTIRALEAKGVKKPPSFLLTEAKRELDLLEPEIDDSGITDEQAEARSKAYMENRESLAAQIAKKRRENAQAFEEAEFAEANANLPDDNDDEDDIAEHLSGGDLFDDLNLDDMT